MQLHREYGVAVERLTYCTSRTIDESALLVEVTGKSHLDTRSSENPQRRLRSGIAQIPPRHLFFVDPRNSQGSPTYLSGTLVGAGEPSEYLTMSMT